MRPVKNHSIPLVTRAQLRGPGTAARQAWRTSYVRRLVASDAACALLAATATVQLRPSAPLPPAVLVLLAPLVWVAASALARGYDRRLPGVGPEEFRRVLSATALSFAAVVGLSWAVQPAVSRSAVVLLLSLTCLLTLAERNGWRRWLHRQQRNGRAVQTMLLVGHRGGVAALHDQLRRQPHHGYDVVGCCLPTTGERHFDGLPVLGDLDDVVRIVEFYEVDAVALLPTPELDGGPLRRLGWGLEETSAQLLVAPAVAELAGPRLLVRPWFGLPLLQLERPELRGARRLLKETFDRVAVLVVLALVLPVLVAVAVAVKVSSPGPVLCREQRVGRDGEVFGLLRFRCTVSDGERDADDGAPATLYPAPQETSIGRLLRRHSLDRLPQLFHVLGGTMSLVGPRPPRPSDVEQWGPHAQRRFLVKPGLTGTAPMSGQSELTWDDAVRLDVRYVETWSFAMDLMILGRALRGLRRRGTP